MLVFDKWTCNTNGRQTVFFEAQSRQTARSPDTVAAEGTPEMPGGYKTVMIDQGFCFNAGEWNFPDAPLRGLYARNRVYEGVTGMESFTPWLERLERMSERVLGEVAEEIPAEWHGDDFEAVERLLVQLHRRRTRVPDLLLAARDSNRQPFLNWRHRYIA